MVVAVAVAESVGVAMPVAVPVALPVLASEKDFLIIQKHFLINVWAYENNCLSHA